MTEYDPDKMTLEEIEAANEKLRKEGEIYRHALLKIIEAAKRDDDQEAARIAREALGLDT